MNLTDKIQEFNLDKGALGVGIFMGILNGSATYGSKNAHDALVLASPILLPIGYNIALDEVTQGSNISKEQLKNLKKDAVSSFLIGYVPALVITSMAKISSTF